MLDSFRHKGLRKQLVDVLSKKGINNPKILEGINSIPRHLFIDNAFVDFAYKDQAFPIGSGQTISQPYTVAFQTELLDPQPYEKILEVGTGSGYQTSLLLYLESDVYSIERQKELYLKTKSFLPKLGYKCHLIYGDGYKGLPKFAPFDKIIVTCGAPSIPLNLIKQIKIRGKMVVPIGDSSKQVMHLIERISENEIRTTKHGDFLFVPMLNDTKK
tara:strand:- start:261 stop:905 length:645 start_codon:yes stop_codon:yes gene_type:complete